MDESAKWYRVKPSYPKPAGGFLAIGPRYPGELVDGGTAVRFVHHGDRTWTEVVPIEHVEPLVIRFEREGEERFARWIGGEDWREREALDRLFTESDRVRSVERPPLPAPPPPNDDTGVGPAPPETVALWVDLVASMGADELALASAK